MWILKRRRLRKAVRGMPDWKCFELCGGPSRKPSLFYLAYGSNLSLERMSVRCPDAQVAGTAKIHGYRLLFKKSKSGFYATIRARTPTAMCRCWCTKSANSMRPC